MTDNGYSLLSFGLGVAYVVLAVSILIVTTDVWTLIMVIPAFIAYICCITHDSKRTRKEE